MAPIPKTSRFLSFEMLASLSDEELDKLTVQYMGLRPNDILTMITRLENDVLVKIKVKDGEQSDRYKFYNSVLRIMYVAMQAQEQVDFWRNNCMRFKMECEFHKQSAAQWYNQLLEYKTIEKLVQQGDLDKYIEQVKERNKR